MAHSGGEKRPRPWAFGTAALVCLALLALLTVAQVVHVHPLDSNADQCQLCVAMHSAAPVAVTAAVVVLVEMGAPAAAIENRSAIRFRFPQLFIRPPPAGCRG